MRKATGSYHLFIPSKTAPLDPEFAVEELPLGRTAVLVSEFAVKGLPLAANARDLNMCYGVLVVAGKQYVSGHVFLLKT